MARWQSDRTVVLKNMEGAEIPDPGNRSNAQPERNHVYGSGLQKLSTPKVLVVNEDGVSQVIQYLENLISIVYDCRHRVEVINVQR